MSSGSGTVVKSMDSVSTGKSFNQSQRQVMAPQGCTRYRQGYGHPCCGEPYTLGEGMPAHNRPCISYCNAPNHNVTATPISQQAQMGSNANLDGQDGYEQHATNIAKFKEMFPAASQGLRSNNNFDPIDIAVQMNPANKQGSSVDYILTTTPMPAKPVKNPVMNSMNAANRNYSQNQAAAAHKATNQMRPNQYANNLNQNEKVQVHLNEQHAADQQPQHRQECLTNQIHHPHVCTGLTHNQGKDRVLQDSNTQNYQEPTEPMSQGYPNQCPSGRVYEREPELPVDIVTYNTIGQPIKLVPAKKYHAPQPNLPQTLSPQTFPSRLRTQMNNNAQSDASNSLISSRQQLQEKAPSRVQQVYDQYNGSQSCTNQKEIIDPVTGQTVSDGRLNGAPPNIQKQMFLEKVGGDTAVHNQAQNKSVKGGQVVGQVEDKSLLNKADMMPGANSRNGLQDMVFTSYSHSTAWSFNGRRGQPTPSIRA